MWTTQQQMEVLYSASVQTCRKPARERARAMCMTEQQVVVLYSASVQTRRTRARDTARAIWRTQRQDAADGGDIFSFGVNIPHNLTRHCDSHMDSRAADRGAILSFRATMPHSNSRNRESHADDKHQAEARCLAAVQICHITEWRSNSDADIKHQVDTLSFSVQASRATTSERRRKPQRRKQDWEEWSKPALASLMDKTPSCASLRQDEAPMSRV